MKNFNKDLLNIKNNQNKRIEYIKRSFIFACQHSLAGQHTPITDLINVLTLRDKQAINVLISESTYLKIKCKKSKQGNQIYQVVNAESTISDPDNVDLLINAAWSDMYDITKTSTKKDFTEEALKKSIKALIEKCNKNGIDFYTVLNDYRHKAL
jgi:translation initiation factor 2 alpha subunit (eIF-2alpha)